MRLSKIQKYLKENNINYEIKIDTYLGYEFGDIDIKSDKTVVRQISEITGNNGRTPSGIMVFKFDKERNCTVSFTVTNQDRVIEIINRDIE